VSLTQPRRGDRGQIMRGAFVGHTARFDGRDDDRGVDHVLVDAFGQLTPIELPIGAWAA